MHTTIILLLAASRGVFGTLRQLFSDGVDQQLQAFGSARVRAAGKDVIDELAKLLAGGASPEEMVQAIETKVPGAEEMTLEEYKGALLTIGRAIDRGVNVLNESTGFGPRSPKKVDWDFYGIGGGPKDAGSPKKIDWDFYGIAGGAKDASGPKNVDRSSYEIAGGAKDASGPKKIDWDFYGIAGGAKDASSSKKIVRDSYGIGGEVKGEKSARKEDAESMEMFAYKSESIPPRSVDRDELRKKFVERLDHRAPLRSRDINNLLDAIIEAQSKTLPTLEEVLLIEDANLRLRTFASIVPHDVPLSVGDAELLMERVTQKSPRRTFPSRPDFITLEQLVSSRRGKRIHSRQDRVAAEILSLPNEFHRRAVFTLATPHDEPLWGSQADSLLDAYREAIQNPKLERPISEIIAISDPEKRRREFSNAVPHSEIILNSDWDTLINLTTERSLPKSAEPKRAAGLKAIQQLSDAIIDLGLGAKPPTKDDALKLIAEIAQVPDDRKRRALFVETFPHPEPLTLRQIDSIIEASSIPRVKPLPIEDILQIADPAERRRAMSHLVPHDTVVPNSVWDELITKEIEARK